MIRASKNSLELLRAAGASLLSLPKRGVRYVRALSRPEQAVLLIALLLHGVALFWGLPSSDAWDNDGVAPRDILPGLVETFTPGQHYTYPPLQLMLVALLTLPMSVYALGRSASLQQADVVRAFLDPTVMTTFTVVARTLSLLFSLGIVLAMGELAALLSRAARGTLEPNESGGPDPPHARRDSRDGDLARLFGMALAAVNVALTYYAQTSNLDVPYLFWASLSLLGFARSIAYDRPRGLRSSALFAALAISTKDQAYALFLLSLPTCALLWAKSRGSRGARELLREAVIAAAMGIGLVLVIDGAIYNPRGFLARVRFLLGPASQDFAQYSKDLAGRAAAFADSWLPFPQHFPVVFLPVFVLGLLLALRGGAPRARAQAIALAILPLAAALSFTLMFNCWARRVEERFVMPQMVLVSVYGAVALAWAWERLRARGRAARLSFVVFAAVSFAWAVRMSASVDAVMLGDPRYDAEDYLASHAKPDDAIEVYGRNVYLPRFRPWMRVSRVGPEPVAKRSPMPGVVEVEAHYGEIAARKPRFIVVGEGFAWRYLIGEWRGENGRVQPTVHRENLSDHDATRHFHQLFEETGDYKKALHARYQGTVFPIVRMHGSLGAEVFVFERK